MGQRVHKSNGKTEVAAAAPAALVAAPRVHFVAYFVGVVGLFSVVTMYISIQQTTAVPGLPGIDIDTSFSVPRDKPGLPANLATVSCKKYGGPDDLDPAVREMIYWEDIPQDNKHVSPFHKGNKNQKLRQYLTFEPDHGGFNNIRMAMETVLAMAFAMGRTLVLPPEQPMYLLDQKTTTSKEKSKVKQKHHFSFNDFFHMDSIHEEHIGLDIITMEQYLIQERENFRYRKSVEEGGHGSPINKNEIAYPPGNRTNWDGSSHEEVAKLYKWLQSVSYQPPTWDPEDCLIAFPASTSEADIKELQRVGEVVAKESPRYELFIDKPFPVNASIQDRLRENWAERKGICIYDKEMQNTPSIHFGIDRKSDSARLLVHFYAFLSFQDYRHDLWMKRFVRDHVRYTDEIICAAARVIAALRQRVRNRQVTDLTVTGGPKGEYDSMHGTKMLNAMSLAFIRLTLLRLFFSFLDPVRRGDFQYKVTKVSGEEMYGMTKRQLPENATLFIATDEKSKQAFFKPLMEHYDVVFLDDFMGAIGPDVNSNYYGMVSMIEGLRIILQELVPHFFTFVTSLSHRSISW
jgi:GDP-fucose protein O-fucosyltransferase